MRGILEEAGPGRDYLEIGLDGAWQWNPLDDPLLDTYSLAYTVSTLINQLFGKSREPCWQQAYTNLVRWIIELHRLLPGARSYCRTSTAARLMRGSSSSTARRRYARPEARSSGAPAWCSVAGTTRCAWTGRTLRSTVL